MKTKGAIKIIKKREVSAGSDPAKKATVTTPQAVREMKQTVSAWVDEFHQRRDIETTRELRTLFPASS